MCWLCRYPSGPVVISAKPEVLKWELLVFPKKNSPVCQDPVNSWLMATGPLGTSCHRREEGEEQVTVFLVFRLVSRAPCLAFLLLHGSLFTCSPGLTHSHTLLAPAWLSYLQFIPQTYALSLPGLRIYYLQDQYPGPDPAPPDRLENSNSHVTAHLPQHFLHDVLQVLRVFPGPDLLFVPK